MDVFAAAPVVVLCATVALKTGWRLRAAEVPVEVFVAAEAAVVVPAPACALKVPEATPEVAVAVVEVAAAAAPAKPIIATAETAARNFFMCV